MHVRSRFVRREYICQMESSENLQSSSVGSTLRNRPLLPATVASSHRVSSTAGGGQFAIQFKEDSSHVAPFLPVPSPVPACHPTGFLSPVHALYFVLVMAKLFLNDPASAWIMHGALPATYFFLSFIYVTVSRSVASYSVACCLNALYAWTR